MKTLPVFVLPVMLLCAGCSGAPRKHGPTFLDRGTTLYLEPRKPAPQSLPVDRPEKKAPAEPPKAPKPAPPVRQQQPRKPDAEPAAPQPVPEPARKAAPKPKPKPTPETAPPEKPAASESKGDKGDPPAGLATPRAGRVKSPFWPHRELDVSDLPSGSLATDPISGKIFKVP